MITICMGCTRIRTDDGPWTYDAAPASGASHGYCEDCEAEQQAMVDKFAERMRATNQGEEQR